MSPRLTSPVYCPECGHENPGGARFCMNCGHSLAGYTPGGADAGPAAGIQPRERRIDWTAIATAGLALLGLRYASRRARRLGCFLLFLLLFFGGPMACGLIMALAQAVGNLFR